MQILYFYSIAFLFSNDGVWTGQLDVATFIERIEYYYEIKHFGFERFQRGTRVYDFYRK